MAFLPYTLADFRLVSAGTYLSAAGGAAPTATKRHDCSFPLSTGTGDQNVNTPDIDATQCMVAVCDFTSSRSSRLTHTTDPLKRIRSTDLAGAAIQAVVGFAIFAPPAGLFQ